MTRADFEAVRNPLLALGAILLVAAAAVYYTDQLALGARRELAQQETQLKDARTRLQNSGDEKEIIVRYLGAYQQLQKRGFVGDEQRINWLDALRLTNQQADLFGVDYDIGAQKALPLRRRAEPGPDTAARIGDEAAVPAAARGGPAAVPRRARRARARASTPWTSAR